MRAFFDWVRHCRTGGELMALLSGAVPAEVLTPRRKYEPPEPSTLFIGVCRGCGAFPATADNGLHLCPACQTLRREGRKRERSASHARVLWGRVNRIPRWVSEAETGGNDPVHHGCYIHDDSHFLLMLPGRNTLPFFRQLMLYDGHDLKGFLQLFPTVGVRYAIRMMDLLIRACHYETIFPMNALRVRCFTRPRQMFNPGRHEKGRHNITFEVGEFISLLEGVRIFRSLLHPSEQQMLREHVESMETGGAGESFMWGRIVAALSPEARDMLAAWDFRNWPPERITYFFDLFAYVTYTP